MIVYLNDRFLPIADARIPITDRGFLYGDALYETVRVQDSGYVRFEEHYRRLQGGARALRIPVPEADTLRRIGGELAARNGVFDGTLRVTLTRGPGGEGLAPRDAGPPTVAVSLTPIAHARLRRAEAGWSVIVASARRAPAALPAAIVLMLPAGRLPAAPPPARIVATWIVRPAPGTTPRTPSPKRTAPASGSRL